MPGSGSCPIRNHAAEARCEARTFGAHAIELAYRLNHAKFGAHSDGDSMVRNQSVLHLRPSGGGSDTAHEVEGPQLVCRVWFA